MDRRRFLLTSLAGVLAAPLGVGAQQVGKVYRIGFLSTTGCPIQPEIMGPFHQGLLELGYVEGQNIVIECRGAPRATDRLHGFAAELVLLALRGSEWVKSGSRG
jgi:putative tryptophan/tyrosine transport system substrate-binding protein